MGYSFPVEDSGGAAKVARAAGAAPVPRVATTAVASLVAKLYPAFPRDAEFKYLVIHRLFSYQCIL